MMISGNNLYVHTEQWNQTNDSKYTIESSIIHTYYCFHDQ